MARLVPVAKLVPVDEPPAFDPMQTDSRVLSTPIEVKRSLKTPESPLSGAGIPHSKLRTMLSLAQSDPEKVGVMRGMVGEGNFGIAPDGRYYVLPEGMKRLGLSSTEPVAVEDTAPTRYDVLDIAGDVPPLVGALGSGMLASKLGVVPGMAMTAAGGALGQAAKEAVRKATGVNQQTPAQTAGKIAEAGLESSLGEGAFRLLRKGGRFLMGPGAERMTPEGRAALWDLLGRGYLPSPGQIRGGQIETFEGIANRFFGNLSQERNVERALAEFKQLKASTASPLTSREDVGGAVSQALIGARQNFASQMEPQFRYADDLLAGEKISLVNFKEAVRKIYNDLPKTADTIIPATQAPPVRQVRTTGQGRMFVQKPGEITPEKTIPGQAIAGREEPLKFIKQLMAMDDFVTSSELQQIRTMAREAGIMQDLVPGLPKRHAITIHQAADRAFDEFAAQGGKGSLGVQALRAANSAYKKGIKRFDHDVIARITRDAGQSGSVDPDMVLEFMVRPRHATRVHRVMSLLDAPVRDQVRRRFAEDVSESFIQPAENPLRSMLSGKVFRETLDNYGYDTVSAVMGKEWTNAAYKLADAVKLVTSGNKQAGGLVVQHTKIQMVTNPVNALAKMGAYRAFARFIQNPKVLYWLTEGIAAPTSRKTAEWAGRLSAQWVATVNDETDLDATTKLQLIAE